MFDQLEKIHKIQLEMALDVKKICEKYSIRYFIVAGTLLGAVRHGGFIPWDDDLDIGMLREDYEKFIEVSKNELSNDNFLQNWNTEPKFALPITKIRRIGTKFVEQNSAKVQINKGVYIDIFPFDQVPRKIMERRSQNIMTYVIKRILLIRQGYKLWDDKDCLKKLLYKILKIASKMISVNRAKQILYKVMTKYNYINSDYIVTHGGSYGYWKETINKKWIENLTSIEFEGHLFPCPNDYHNYLINMYGDYMKLPPESDRYNRHEIIKLELGEKIK
jgi:lipopolysaccharide cholinephosphotransferase